jgi:hypothetical protein
MNFSLPKVSTKETFGFLKPTDKLGDVGVAAEKEKNEEKTQFVDRPDSGSASPTGGDQLHHGNANYRMQPDRGLEGEEMSFKFKDLAIEMALPIRCTSVSDPCLASVVEQKVVEARANVTILKQRLRQVLAAQ